jgi:CHASE3 domain sensor protein
MLKVLPLSIAILVLIFNIASAGIMITQKGNFEDGYVIRTLTIRLEKHLSYLKDVETGARGFILTQEPQFLEPYERSVAEIKINSDNMTTDIYADKLEFIKEKSAKLIEYHDRVIQLGKSQNFEEAERVIKTREGKLQMDSIRLYISDLQQKLTDHHNEKIKSFSNSLILPKILMHVNGIVGMLLIVLLFARMVEWKDEKWE